MADFDTVRFGIIFARSSPIMRIGGRKIVKTRKMREVAV